jgi:hypothetical protein
MPDLDVTILALRVLSERLIREGADDLRRELNKKINDAAQPAIDDVYRRLPDYMPDRYAEVLETDMRITISKTKTGVRIRAPERGVRSVERRRLIRLNRGVLSHPLFGNRRHWFDQTDGVSPGFFDEPLQAHVPEFRQAVVAAMAETARKLTRKA